MTVIRIICVSLIYSLLAQKAWAYDRITGLPFAGRSEVIAQHGMAASSQPLATQVALDILKKGGNAIDAAIAANAMLGLLEPTGSGIGGDLFAIVWDAKTQKLYGLNASGRSPKSLTFEYFKQQGLTQIPAYGPLPVTVPGTVDGWFELHGKFGNLPMTSILAPAIEYAKKGFPVSELTAHYMQSSLSSLSQYPGFSDTYMVNGQTPEKGQIWQNSALANTYEKIATGGRDVFYKGDMARIIAAFMQDQGGKLNYEDLATHSSQWLEPVSVNYRGYEVWELPPKGQGIAALQILNVLEQYDLESMGFGSADYIHTFIEAKKLAFEETALFYVDPTFNLTPVSTLLSKDYAKQKQQLIDPKKAAKRYDMGNDQGDAIYLSTADSDGNMVSLIQGNYRGMGSGMTPTGLGFTLQNRGELFTLRANQSNTYEPGKRPFHTMLPAFVSYNGKPWLSFGVSGGAAQPQIQAQIIVNLIDFGMNLQEAGDAPRILHSGTGEPTGELLKDGGYVSLENGFSALTRRELLGKGHSLREVSAAFGGYQAIMRDAKTGVYYGASESRKDGQAAGY